MLFAINTKASDKVVKEIPRTGSDKYKNQTIHVICRVLISLCVCVCVHKNTHTHTYRRVDVGINTICCGCICGVPLFKGERISHTTTPGMPQWSRFVWLDGGWLQLGVETSKQQVVVAFVLSISKRNDVGCSTAWPQLLQPRG